MKQALIVVVLIAGVLALLLFTQSKSAGKALAAARADAQWASNQLTQLQVRLTEQTKATVTWQDLYSNRVATLTALSNDLTQATGALDAARAEVRKLADKLKASEAELAQLRLEKTELAAALDSTRVEITALRRDLLALQEQRATLAEQLNRVRIAKDELQHRFNNPAALKAQLALLTALRQPARPKADKQPPAAPDKQSDPAHPKPDEPLRPTDKHVRLQLQPDGSVKLVRIGGN
jgi:chromosome segregation ATPase